MANTVIGRVVATEKNPTTIDNFTFWTDPELILNPFDIVKVQHVNNSFSYGVIEDIAHITDAASFLTNFISSVSAMSSGRKHFACGNELCFS